MPKENNLKTIANILKHLPRLQPLDREVLLAWAIKKNKEWMLTHTDYTLSKSELRAFKKAVQRRRNHEPIAYITGTKEFYGQPFFVTKDTLIPRPETEHLVDEALEYIVETGLTPSLQIIDVGTGSGNIVLSVAMQTYNTPLNPLLIEGKYATPSQNEDSPPLCIRGGGGSLLPYYTAADISKKALKIAKQNHKNLCPEIPVTFIKSDLLTHIPKSTWDKKHILILANLPYLPESDSTTIAKDITQYEPKSALYSGKQGLDHLTKLIGQIRKLKTENRKLTLIAEIDPRQSALLKKQFPSAKIKKDLSKKDRIFIKKFQTPNFK